MTMTKIFWQGGISSLPSPPYQLRPWTCLWTKKRYFLSINSFISLFVTLKKEQGTFGTNLNWVKKIAEFEYTHLSTQISLQNILKYYNQVCKSLVAKFFYMQICKIMHFWNLRAKTCISSFVEFIDCLIN